MDNSARSKKKKRSPVDEYLGNDNWRLKENANFNRSFSGLLSYIADKEMARYVLKKMPRQAAKAHINGDIHIHNLSRGIIAYCYHPDTRILTSSGFKKISEITFEDEIATYNQELDIVEYHKPIRIFKKRHDGFLIHFKGRRHSLLVSPDQKLFVYLGKRGCFEFIDADEIYSDLQRICYMKYGLLRRAKWEGEHPEFITVGEKRIRIEPFVKFIAWWLSEGSVKYEEGDHYEIMIYQNLETEKANEIHRVIEEMGFRPFIVRSSSAICFSSQELAKYLLKIYKPKRVPEEIKRLDPALLREFILTYAKGDGSIKDNSIALYTSSEILRDDLLEIALRSGATVSYSYCEGGEYEGYQCKGTYHIYVGYSSKYSWLKRAEKVPYHGYVYDVEVPNHTILVEYEGKIQWSSNCHGGSLLSLLEKGLFSGAVHSSPAKHFDTAIDHVSNYFLMAQGEFAGALAFSSFNTFLAPFVYYDKLSRKEVKQGIQRLVYNCNFTVRAAFQTMFTNLTFDARCPRMFRDTPVIIGGKPQENTYGDFEEEARLILEVFSEVLLEKDPNGIPFTFPIPTINIGKDFRWDLRCIKKLVECSAKLGSWYYMNFRGSNIDEDSVRAMCCHLQLDTKSLPSRGGFWNFADGTGSYGVCTINLPRLGYLSKDESQLYDRLDDILEIVKSQLIWKREMIIRTMKAGLMPFMAYYNFTLDRYFATIGLIGLNEMCLNLTGESILENKRLVINVIKHVKERAAEFMDETGTLWNVELVPGEGSSYRLAYIDRKKFRRIITLGTKDAPYYSALLVPPSYTLDLLEKISFEEDILPLFDGGAVSRVFLGETPDTDMAVKLLRVLSNTKLPYFDLTPTFSICPVDGTFHQGVVEKCRICGHENDIYSRVVGYYRPYKKYNVGKLQEAKERVLYTKKQISKVGMS